MRWRILVAAALLVLALAGTAGAADEPPEGTVTLRADRQEWVDRTRWIGTGNVQILYQDVKITCDEITLNTETMDLVARGNVIMDQGPRRFTADELTYNLRTKTGSFTNATGQVDPFYYFTGEEVERLDETHFRLRKATFTSCEPEPRPPWRFGVSSALVEEEGYGRFKGLTVQVKGVPVFYLPYLLWPVKTERTTGLLVPTFGFSNQRGFYLGNSLYIVGGRSWDTTVYFDWYSKGYYGIGDQLRWTPSEGSKGFIVPYAIRDKDTGRWEWKVDGVHEQKDVLGFRLLSEVHLMSDVDFFREFEHTFDRNTLRSLYSYVFLTKTRGPATLNLRLDRRTTYFTTTDVVLQQLPEVEFRVRSTRLGRTSLYWSLISSVNLFDVDRGGGLATTYGRVDVYPQLAYTLPGPPWLTVTPKVAVRGTYYTSRYNDNQTAFVDEGIDRSFLEAALDMVGPSISRIYPKEKGRFLKLKHLVEPRLEYRYVSDPGDIRQIPRFDEVDQTLVTNRVRLLLSNRLYGKEREAASARELGSFDIFGDYSFGDPLTVGSGGRESKFGALGLALRLTPTRGVYIDGRAAWDTLFHSLQSTSLSANLSGRGRFANLTWYQGFIPETGTTTSSQVRAALGWRSPDSRWDLAVHVAYDVKENRFQQQRLVVRYGGSCWGVTTEYRDLDFAAGATNRDIRISIDLKGLGKLLEIKSGIDSF